MKTFQIVYKDGVAKPGWEEINCYYMTLIRDIAEFYDSESCFLLAYKLAEGEAIILTVDTKPLD